MDEGVIYEEGEPDKIFTSPSKDKTRQFINHLRIFTYKLRVNKDDALSLIHEADSFSHKYMIPQDLNFRLLRNAVKDLVYTSDDGRIHIEGNINQ